MQGKVNEMQQFRDEERQKRKEAECDVEALRKECQRLEAEIAIIVDEIGFVRNVGAMSR